MFSEGRAAIRLSEESGWSFINEVGEVITSKEYYDCSEFINGIAIVESNRKYGFINLDGNEVVPCEYDSIQYNGSGYYHAHKDKTHYLFNSSAACIFESDKYDISDTFNMGSFSTNKGVIKIYGNSRYGLIDIHGKEVLPPTYSEMKHFSGGLCAVARYVDGIKQWGFINIKGEESIPSQFQEVNDFHDGVATFRAHFPDIKEHISPNGRKVGYPGGYFADGMIDTKGNIIVEANKYHLGNSQEHLVRCTNDDGFVGFLDSKGQEVIPCQYERGSSFYHGIAIIKDSHDKWGAIDLNGKVVIPFEHDWLVDYNTDRYKDLFSSKGDVIFKKNGKFGILNTVGNVIIPFKYDEIKICPPNSFIVRVNNQYGVINQSGEYVIPLKMYKRIERIFSPIDLGLVRVYINNDETGIVDVEGRIRVPCKFYYINNGHMGGTDFYGNMFRLSHLPDCILSVRRRTLKGDSVSGRADLFGDFIIDEN